MKKYLLLLFVLISVGCTGCVSSRYELTEQENEMIAEYIAGIMLKRDIGYNRKLEYETEEAEIPVSTDELSVPVEVNQPKENITEATPETTPNETPVKYSKLMDIYGNKKFQITYSGCKTFSNYPDTAENDYFLPANKGNQLLVLFFKVKNNTKEKSNLNLMSSGIQYQLETDSGSVKKPLLTALINDLQYLDINLEGGKSEEAVIIFEVSNEAKLEQYYLYATVGDKTAQEKIK